MESKVIYAYGESIDKTRWKKNVCGIDTSVSKGKIGLNKLKCLSEKAWDFRKIEVDLGWFIESNWI